MPAKKGKKGKGKKGKKNAVSKERKLLLELQSAADVIRNKSPELRALLKRMLSWFTIHASYLAEILQPIDFARDGAVTYDQFKIGLLDMRAPCNNAEIYLLCSLLDTTNSGRVIYLDLPTALHLVYESIVMEEDSRFHTSKLDLTVREFAHCVCCNIALFEPIQDKAFTYLYLDIRCIPLLQVRSHTFHRKFIFSAQSLVQSLINRLINDLDIASNKVTIFRDHNKGVESILAVDVSLEECGYPGGNYTNPSHVMLFYDYMTEYLDSPVLLSDDFSVDKRKVVSPDAESPVPQLSPNHQKEP